MRQIFTAGTHETVFREYGYVVTDLLDEPAIEDLWSFYAASFKKKREVVPYAQQLPYYISVFDRDSAHKREVDGRISKFVSAGLQAFMLDYEVFYSNFMIKFPGDGQIEAHQDFNFVDESQHTAFNLWCPLVDTDTQNGGLFVIPGSHNVFLTQRGPNLPKALTEHNNLLRKYARWVPLKKGQAIIFDHKLIHYSPPNRTKLARVAIQSVLKPREAAAVHYVFDAPAGKVRAFRIDKQFILENNLWDMDPSKLAVDHEQDLIPLLTPEEMTRKLAGLTLMCGGSRNLTKARRVFREESAQEAFERDGFVKLSVLAAEDVQELTKLFVESTGGTVANTAYGMYISLEEKDLAQRRALIKKLSGILLPKVSEHFQDCKPHLGSFLVKAPGQDSYTYPHQDWTFVDPPFVSITVWIALVDTDINNGALGFVRGSQSFFDKPVGSPSPPFQTCTQGHEGILYEYLDFVPLKAGEAVAFDNRTIHGATPNLSTVARLAVAIGMTPKEAQLFHYFLVPKGLQGGRRTLAKLQVDEEFFEHYSVTGLKEMFDANQMPGHSEVAATLEDDFIAFSADEICQLCEQAGLKKNGLHLGRRGAVTDAGGANGRPSKRLAAAVGSIWKTIFRS